MIRYVSVRSYYGFIDYFRLFSTYDSDATLNIFNDNLVIDITSHGSELPLEEGESSDNGLPGLPLNGMI